MENGQAEQQALYLSGARNLTIDDRWRIQIPSDVRTTIERAGETNAFYIGRDPLNGNILLYPEKQFRKLASERKPSLKPDAAQRDYNYQYAADVERIEWDSQGRVLLGEELAKARHPNREITLVGAVNWLEVWNREPWLKEKARREQEAAEDARFAYDLERAKRAQQRAELAKLTQL